MLVKARRRYAEEFKIEAVRLVREFAHPVAQVARDLGIPENVLYRWRTQHQQAEVHGTTGELLGQCLCREFLRHIEARARLSSSVPHTGRGDPGHL